MNSQWEGGVMLTVWEQLQLLASEQVEVLEVGQLPEAFGE